MEMKNMLKYILSAMLVLAAGCSPDKELAGGTDITGEWKLVSMDGVPAETLDLEIYMGFDGDGHFETFVPNGEGLLFVRTYGTYSVAGDFATGTYSNGSSWASGYTVEVSGNELTMTSDGGECVYEETDIPDEVRDGAQDVPMSTKATERFFIL